jgi:hypothetical protein
MTGKKKEPLSHILIGYVILVLVIGFVVISILSLIASISATISGCA